jgi:DNA-binding winged helix-turn-helix (wHTH) protein
MRLRFGDCVVDGDTREVFRAEEPVAISPRAYALLALLIEARPGAVSKSDIHARLWPGVHVSDANLPNLVGELRASLGDEARRPRIIRTVPRFGYAFCANARTERRSSEKVRGGSDLAYRLVWGSREITLEPGENLIGRDSEAVVWIDDERVSRRHARILIGPERATIEDLGSKNGTFLDGKRIRTAVSLTNRETVKIGPANMTFRVMRRTGSTRSTKNKEPR